MSASITSLNAAISSLLPASQSKTASLTEEPDSPATTGTASSFDSASVILSIGTLTAGSSTSSNTSDSYASVAAATNSALGELSDLSKLAAGFGDNPKHVTIGTWVADSSGTILSGAWLDGSGNVSVYGTGASGHSVSQVGLRLTGNDSGTEDWSERASTELSQADKALQSILQQYKSDQKKDTGSLNLLA